jgi:hypothetical protein
MEVAEVVARVVVLLPLVALVEKVATVPWFFITQKDINYEIRMD